MTDLKETACEYITDNNTATFCSSETKWINRILRLKNEYPDCVDIKYMPENNDGVILAHIPKSWFKISPPKKMNMTDEQRAAAAERLRKSRGC